MSAVTRSSRQLFERGDEVRPDEARVARKLCRELREAVLGGRIAVDRYQRPARSDSVGDEPRVAPSPERAVHGHFTRLRIEELDQLAGEDRDVGLGHVK